MRAVHPFKGSIDIHVVDIIMELAGESDGIQGVAVGDGVLAQRRCAGGSDPVLRADVDGQGDILIVARGNCNSDRAECSFVRAASDCVQCQLAGLAVYKGNKGANAQIGINLLVIGDRAVVTGSSQLRQQR